MGNFASDRLGHRFHAAKRRLDRHAKRSRHIPKVGHSCAFLFPFGYQVKSPAKKCQTDASFPSGIRRPRSPEPCSTCRTSTCRGRPRLKSTTSLARRPRSSRRAPRSVSTFSRRFPSSRTCRRKETAERLSFCAVRPSLQALRTSSSAWQRRFGPGCNSQIVAHESGEVGVTRLALIAIR